MAIGARSQAARTYLEKFLDDFKTCDLDELVKHGLRALRDTLPNEVTFSKLVYWHNCLQIMREQQVGYRYRYRYVYKTSVFTASYCDKENLNE
jgi:20S proteasome alpha/beta subunit